jgi:Adenylate cyclase regulatory domain/Sigma-70, region 4
MTAAEFEAAGLYDPKAPNAPDRLELLEWLAARGVTVAQMARATRGHSLSGLAGELALRSGERYTLAQVAERAGVPIERVRQLSLASGLPPTTPDAPVFTDDDVLLFGGFAGRAALFGEAPLLRFVRTGRISLIPCAGRGSRLVRGGVKIRRVGRRTGASAAVDRPGTIS